jgi:hypothetical protein
MFLGSESTYFACNTQTGGFSTNIESAEFSDWLTYSACNPFDRADSLKSGYVPHSLALGPNDIFCWIAKNDYKTSSAFQKLFPAIERYLAFAKAKKQLDGVVSTPSNSTRNLLTFTEFRLQYRLPAWLRPPLSCLVDLQWHMRQLGPTGCIESTDQVCHSLGRDRRSEKRERYRMWKPSLACAN